MLERNNLHQLLRGLTFQQRRTQTLRGGCGFAPILTMQTKIKATTTKPNLVHQTDTLEESTGSGGAVLHSHREQRFG